MKIPHGIFTKARLLARGISETDVHQAIKDKRIIVRRDGTLQSRPPKLSEAADEKISLSVCKELAEAVELAGGTTVQQIKDGKPVRRQVIKRNGSKYSVIDPETKQIEDVDEKDLAVVNDEEDKNKPPGSAPAVVKEAAERYENYYDDGGHGGPHMSIADAITSATSFLSKGLIRTGKGTYIVEIRPYSSTEKGGFGPRHEGSLYVRRTVSHDGEGERIKVTDAQGNVAKWQEPPMGEALADRLLDEAGTKYLVWIDEGEGNGWEEQGDGPLTLKQAERISREIRKECGCMAVYLPVGQKPAVESIDESAMGRLSVVRSEVNKSLGILTRNNYFRRIPTTEIASIFNDNGLPTDVLEGIYTGRDGRIGGARIGDTGLRFTMTWHMMDSGNYEIVAYVS